MAALQSIYLSENSLKTLCACAPPSFGGLPSKRNRVFGRAFSLTGPTARTPKHSPRNPGSAPSSISKASAVPPRSPLPTPLPRSGRELSVRCGTRPQLWDDLPGSSVRLAQQTYTAASGRAGRGRESARKFLGWRLFTPVNSFRIVDVKPSVHAVGTDHETSVSNILACSRDWTHPLAHGIAPRRLRRVD